MFKNYSSPWLNVLGTVIQASFEHLSYISCFVLLPVREIHPGRQKTKSAGLIQSDSSAIVYRLLLIFFHSRPVWLFSFESCVYWFPLVIVSVGTGADSFFAAGMPWKHWQPLPEWICPGMQMLSVMPDQSSAGMPPMSFLIKKGTGFQANPGMFAVLSVTNAITHPHF